MPQECIVLRCFKCDTFQVHIAKKNNKWPCKICNEKQSVKHVYGKGSGKECRLHVQKLNSLRMLKENTKGETMDENVEYEMHESPSNADENSFNQNYLGTQPRSKWLKYVDPEERSTTGVNERDADAGMLNGCKVVYDIKTVSKKRKITPKFQYPNSNQNSSDSIENRKRKNKISKQNKISETGFEWSKAIENVTADDLDINVSEVGNSNSALKNKIPERITCNNNSKWSKFIERRVDDDSTDVRNKKFDQLYAAVYTNNENTKVGFANKEIRTLKRNVNSKWSKYVTDDQETGDLLEDSDENLSRITGNISSVNNLCSSKENDFGPELRVNLIPNVDDGFGYFHSSDKESINGQRMSNINENPKIFSKNKNVFMDSEDDLDDILSI